MKNYLYLCFLLVALTFSLSGMAANRYWIATVTANWNNTANWSATSGGAGGASIPAAADIANFDNNGLGNCTIPAAVTITSLVVNAGYTGTITQSTNPITISGAVTFAGGTFDGSSSTMTIGGALTLSGTTFMFPATLNLNGGSLTYTAGTLDPNTNSSTVVFGAGQTITGSFAINNATFNNTTPWGMTFTLGAGNVLTINGNMAMTGTNPLTYSGGTIDLLGNLSLGNTGTGGGGSTVLTFDGTTNQAITGSPTLNENNLPSVNINKTSGTLSFPAFVSVGGSAWTYTAGTVDVTTNNATVAFVGNVTITGTQTLNNIQFDNSTPWGATYTLAAGTTLTANGNTTFSGTATQTFSGGTIDLMGNLALANTATGGGGSTVLAFTGTTNQAITSSLPLGESALPAVNINKASGTLTLPAVLTAAGSTWTYTTGTIDATTNNSTVVFAANTTISGSHTLNNLQFNNATPWTVTYTLSAGTILTATGNMTISGASAILFSGGTIDLQGNLTLTNTSTSDGGTTYIAFTGTTNQAIISSLPLNEGALPSVNIDKTSGTLTFPSMLTMAGSNWTYTTGTIDATTNSSTVAFGGNTTITGSHMLNNIQFNNATPWTVTYTIAAGTVLIASGNMTVSGASTITFSGGTIDLLGNLVLTNTATGDGGTTVIAFMGTTNQAITSSLPVGESNLPSVNIDKASGTLTLPSLLSVAGSAWTYTTGTIDATTNNSTVVFGNNTTITGSHTLDNIQISSLTPWNITTTIAAGTILTAAGNMTMSGTPSLTLSGGTIDLQGNLILTNTSNGDGGSTVIAFTGTANQAITSALPEGENSLPSITINKPSGTLSIPSLITVAGSAWTYTAGTVDATIAASTVYFTGNTTIKSAGMNFYNLTIVSNTSTLANALTVGNNLTMTSPGVLSAAANTINLAGNWSDWGNVGFTEATSIVNFNGSAIQTITTPGGEIFANMTTNNSASNIQLLNNITISKTLTMTQGNVDLNGNTLTLGLNTANPGTLAYTAGTILGAGSVTRWFKAGVIPIGSVTGLFPVGTSANGRPFSVSAPAAGPTAGGTMTVSYTDGTTTSGVNFPDGAFIVSTIKNLNWAFSTANGLTGGTYDLGISGTGYGVINSVNDLRLTLASSVVGTAGVNGGTTANPQVNRTGLTLANLNNTFFLGSVNPTMTTLPIQFTSFTATPENGEVVLNWSTAEELNSDYFTVQRSADGISWENLQQVAAAGNSSSAAAYTSYDRSPLPGVSHYRLMMTDKDGGTTYSIVALVNFNGNVSGISVYPNPAVNYINISFSTPGNYTLTLVNEIGQVLATNASVNAGNLVWNVSNRTPGIYFIQILSQDGHSETRKIIIRR
jgi:hypothetical protein